MDIIKKRKSGFTLVELIIVMAIFSILLVGAISLVGPVQKIFKNTSHSEKIGSYINNTQKYIEDSLKYAEYLWVYQDLDEANIITEVEKYRQEFYHDIVKYDKTKNKYSFISGDIRVLCLENNNGGRIKLRKYEFNNNQLIEPDLVDGVDQLNEAYFTKASGKSEVLFKYALGTNSKNNTVINGENAISLSNDFDNVKLTSVPCDEFTITILASEKELSKTKLDEKKGYSNFSIPTHISVASLPLLNINYNSTAFGRNSYTRMRLKSGCDIAELSGVKESELKYYLSSVRNADLKVYDYISTSDTNDFQDLDKNIYFIYSYVDEVEKVK